jgi:hypothetical protein
MVGKVVGVGSYGKVRAAWHRLSGESVCLSVCLPAVPHSFFQIFFPTVFAFFVLSFVLFVHFFNFFCHILYYGVNCVYVL